MVVLAVHRRQRRFPALPALALLAQRQEVALPGALAALHLARYERAVYPTLACPVRSDARARVAWTFHFDLFAAFPGAPPGASLFILHNVIRLHKHTKYDFIWAYKASVLPGGFQDSKQRVLLLLQERPAGRKYND